MPSGPLEWRDALGRIGRARDRVAAGRRGARGGRRGAADRDPDPGRDRRRAGRGRACGPAADGRLGESDPPGTTAGYLRHRRGRRGHGEPLDGRGDRGGGMRRPGGQARQPRGLGELGQLGRTHGAGSRGRSGSRSPLAWPGRAEHRLPVRPEVPSRLASRGRCPPPAPVPDPLQPGRTPLQPRLAGLSARRHPGRRPGRT